MPKLIMARKISKRSGNLDDFDIEFWSKVSPGEKILAAIEMLREASLFNGEPDVSKTRLQRNVQNIERRVR